MLNKLLQRQVDKHINIIAHQEPNLETFLTAVNDTYNHYEKDRLMIERTLEISSSELTIANKKLRVESEENKCALNKLQESLQLLQHDFKGHNNKKIKDLNLLDLANIIRQETEQRKKAEDRLKSYVTNLQKSNKELDQFAYIVSHDLKAPLRAIASLADWIKEDSADELTSESKKNLELLRGRVTRMENLIHGILAYSKAGKIQTEKTIVNISELINDILDSLNPPSSIKINLPDNLPFIETEATKLQQVFGNLISNSIKYMDKPEGIINIGWIRLEDKYQFFVEDNGSGIEAKYYDKVFMIFQTLSARDHIESTGIGLSIVKKIIEEQEGNIWIESNLGYGSKFLFTWPVNISITKKTSA